MAFTPQISAQQEPNSARLAFFIFIPELIDGGLKINGLAGLDDGPSIAGGHRQQFL